MIENRFSAFSRLGRVESSWMGYVSRPEAPACGPAQGINCGNPPRPGIEGVVGYDLGYVIHNNDSVKVMETEKPSEEEP